MNTDFWKGFIIGAVAGAIGYHFFIKGSGTATETGSSGNEKPELSPAGPKQYGCDDGKGNYVICTSNTGKSCCPEAYPGGSDWIPNATNAE